VETLVAASRGVLGRSFDSRALRTRAESFSKSRFRRRFLYLLDRALPSGMPG